MTGQPTLGDVEETGRLTGLARGAGKREPRALPHVVLVDLGDRAADQVGELLLHRAQVHALLLQPVALREEELEREDADESASAAARVLRSPGHLRGIEGATRRPSWW